MMTLQSRVNENGRTAKPVEVGVVGLGYWGPNLVRTFDRLPGARLRYGCDLDEGRRTRQAAMYPEATFTPDYDDLLSDDELDAVVISAPAPSHAALAHKALAAGKDVFVEKPLALSPEDAEGLVELAEEKGLVLMTGHLLEYHPGVTRLKEIMDSGELGEVFYVYTHRLNLGVVRRDENALWSLAPHDLSVAMMLLGQEPAEAQASGHSYLRNGVEDVVFGTLEFADGKVAHLHVSWLDPHKERKITVVGSEKMVVFDDMSRDEKLRIYDKGAEKPEYESYGEYINLRFGDVLIPRIPNDEPLKLECEHFVECVAERKRPLSDGRSGLRVVRALDGLQRSLESGGKPVSLGNVRA